MSTFKHRFDFISSLLHPKPFAVLSALWCFGLLIGNLVIFVADQHLVSLMHTVLQDRVSIVRLFAATFFPFLISLFAVCISVPQLIYLICFVEAISIGYCNGCILSAFGDSAWLVHLLYFFSSFSSAPVMFWFFRRCLDENSIFSPRECLICGAVLLLIVSADGWVIAPFAASLF